MWNQGVFLFVAFIHVAIIFAVEKQQQDGSEDTCSDPQNQKECLKLKLENCIKNQVHQSDNVKNECQKGCGQFLGSNSSAVIDCLKNYEFEILNEKLRIMECIEADMASGTASGYNVKMSSININAPEFMQYKVNQAVIKGYLPLKSYKSCMKTCMKRQLMGPAGAGAKQKLIRNAKLNDCHMQIYGKPVIQLEDKVMKRSAKLCSAQIKLEKAALTNKLAECLQAAFSVTPAPSSQNDKKCDCPQGKSKKSGKSEL